MDSIDKILPDNTPAEILKAFYKESELPEDGGISEPRAKLKLTNRIYFYIPNIDARRKALLKHDVHHLLTGYDTLFKGELKIAAWEIGSGCQKYWAAWFLDIQGLMLGLWVHLGGVFKAFVRGRHSMNLYSDIISDNKLKNIPLSEIHEIIKIPLQNEIIKVTQSDLISFLWNVFIGALFSIVVILIYVPFLIIYNLVVFIKLKTTSE